MKYLKIFEDFNQDDKLEFNSPEEFIEYWSEKLSDNISHLPEDFIKAFPKSSDYKDLQLADYDYEDEDDEWEFYPEDEVYRIYQNFDVRIGEEDEDDTDISYTDWVDFYNSAWSWDKNNTN